jgi:hypothetical protein
VFGEQFTRVPWTLKEELTKDLEEEHYLPVQARHSYRNKSHAFTSDIPRDIKKLLHQNSPHESRFESIDKFPKILSLNTHLSDKIDFKPMVSRKFNEVFKPNPTSKGLIHFDVNLKHVRPRELSFFITSPITSPRLQTLADKDEKLGILVKDEGSIVSD